MATVDPCSPAVYGCRAPCRGTTVRRAWLSAGGSDALRRACFVARLAFTRRGRNASCVHYSDRLVTPEQETGCEVIDDNRDRCSAFVRMRIRSGFPQPTNRRVLPCRHLISRVCRGCQPNRRASTVLLRAVPQPHAACRSCGSFCRPSSDDAFRLVSGQLLLRMAEPFAEDGVVARAER